MPTDQSTVQTDHGPRTTPDRSGPGPQTAPVPDRRPDEDRTGNTPVQTTSRDHGPARNRTALLAGIAAAAPGLYLLGYALGRLHVTVVGQALTILAAAGTAIAVLVRWSR
jgi:hypothetical protein